MIPPTPLYHLIDVYYQVLNYFLLQIHKYIPELVPEITLIENK